MQCTDPIADLLTRIRNAQQANHDVVSVPASRMKIGIAHILQEEGFVRAYKCIRDKKQGLLKIALKFDERGKGVITDIHRVSRPSCRIYKKPGDMPKVRNGYGVGIYSTSSGLMTDKQARKANVGGEYLCSVY